MRARSRATAVVLMACVLVHVLAPMAAAQSAEHMNQRAWVTTVDGVEQKGRITSFTGAGIQLRLPDGRIASLPLRDVMRIEVPDGLGNGARDGAIAAAGFLGVPFLISIGSYCSGAGANCRGMAPLVVSGFIYTAALGAGIGVFCDAVRVRRNVIYSASSPASQVTVAPILAPHAAGLRVSWQWPRNRSR